MGRGCAAGCGRARKNTRSRRRAARRRLRRRRCATLSRASVARLRDVDRAGGAVEERLADRPAPPARGPRRLLLVTDDDDVALDLQREPADLLDRLADREVARDLEAALLQLRDAFVQHLLR